MKKFLTVLAFVFVIAAIIAPSSAFAAVQEVGTSADLTTALANGGEVKLTADITTAEGFTVSKDTILDLNGHKLVRSSDAVGVTYTIIVDGAKLTVNDTTKKGSIESINSTSNEARVIKVGDGKMKTDNGNGGTLVINGGTIKATGTSSCAIAIYANSAESEKKITSEVTINKSASVIAGYYGIGIFGKGSKLTLDGGSIETTNKNGWAISGNGSNIYTGNTEVNILSGTVIGGTGTAKSSNETINEPGAGIYHPQSGVLNIKGGIISGYDGVQCKSGTLNITGGEIISSGTSSDYKDSGNGAVITGAALAIITNPGGYPGDIKVNISGTAKLTSNSADVIFEFITSGGTDTKVKEISISGGTFIAKTVDNKAVNFTSWKKIEKLTSIIGGTYSSDPKEYVKSGYVATKNGDVYVVTSEKKPVEPVLPVDTPEKVIPVSADKVVVTSVDMNLEQASKDKAIEEATKVVAKTFTDGGIAQSDLTVNETGKVVAKPELVEKAIKSVTLPKNEVLVTGTITPLPIMKADVSAGKVAAITFEVSAQDLKAKKAGDVKLFKVLSPTKGEFFKFVDTPASVDDTSFALQPLDVASSDFLSADTAIETGKSYRLTMFIKDNGKFDLNKDEGLVADPAELIETKTVTPSSGSSSGCNAGFAALALLAVVPVIYRRKK